MKFKQWLNEVGFKNYPAGWNRTSVRKFANTLSDTIGKKPNEHGWFDACVLKMTKEMGDGAKGFCASVKDEFMGQTDWRGGDKTIKRGRLKKESIDEKNRDYDMGMEVTRKVYKDRFEKMKSPKLLDDLYKDFIEQAKRYNWTNYTKDETEWLQVQFNKTAKRLNVKKEYIMGKGSRK